MFAGPADDANAYMDNAISALQWAYVKGGLKLDLNPDQLAKYYTAGLYDNSALDAVESNYAAVGKYIHQLDTSLRQAVQDGHNSGGYAYTLQQWQSFAQNVADDITSQTGFGWDASVIAEAPSSAVLATEATAATLANPLAWPWWLKGMAGLGIVYFSAPLWGPVVSGLIGRRRNNEPSSS